MYLHISLPSRKFEEPQPNSECVNWPGRQPTEQTVSPVRAGFFGSGLWSFIRGLLPVFYGYSSGLPQVLPANNSPAADGQRLAA